MLSVELFQHMAKSWGDGLLRRTCDHTISGSMFYSTGVCTTFNNLEGDFKMKYKRLGNGFGIKLVVDSNRFYSVPGSHSRYSESLNEYSICLLWAMTKHL